MVILCGIYFGEWKAKKKTEEEEEGYKFLQ